MSFNNIIKNHVVDNGLNVLNRFKCYNSEKLYEINVNDTFPYEVISINLTGELNIGNMIRTCCLSGCQHFHIFGRRKFDRRGTTGAQNYISVTRYNGFIDDNLNYDSDYFLSIIKERNMYPVFIEQNGISLENFPWINLNSSITQENKKLCLIVGNEENGVPENIFTSLKENNIDYSVVSIPQRGVMRSFNVGIALSMVIWDMRKELKWI